MKVIYYVQVNELSKEPTPVLTAVLGIEIIKHGAYSVEIDQSERDLVTWPLLRDRIMATYEIEGDLEYLGHTVLPPYFFNEDDRQEAPPPTE